MASTPNTLVAAVRYFNSENAEAYIESIKWPEGPACPKCGSVSVGRIKSRNRLQCREKGCRKQFSLITGTIMEATHLKLDQWLIAVWMIANCRNGVSSCEIARNIGCKQQSAWHLLHRVRHILEPDYNEPLEGMVEADTTYVGGSVPNMPHRRRRAARKQGSWSHKTIVHVLRERRSGNVRAEIIPSESHKNMRDVVTKHVAAPSVLYTDSSSAYGWAKPEIGYSRSSVNHKTEEYVRGAVHVNGCECFAAFLRRGLYGTYVHADREHLAAYIDEAVYRFNVRKLTEWERFDRAMRQILGKRLTYSELTGGAVR